MTAPKRQRNITPTAAPAAAKPAAAVRAAPPPAPAAPAAFAAGDAELDDLLDEPLTTPAADEPPPPTEPEPLTRKEAAKRAEEERLTKKTAKVKPKISPTDDFIRDKKGAVCKDADGDEMRYAPGFHKQVGFVTEAGVLFPVHFQFPGGFVGSFGNVILHKCPSCGYRNGIDEARSGVCGNQKCRFSQLEQLEQVEL